MSRNPRHAVIAGAGIGGLTAALALHERGWRVTVCERAPGPPALGAGIVLAPNALRAFDAIGFDITRAAGRAAPAAMGVRRTGGDWLNRADTAAMAARYGRPPLAVHRPALADALTAALPDGTIRYGVAVTAVERADRLEGGGPVVRTPAGDLTADVVIAADGIHSALRRQYFPHHPGLRHSGETAWRTVLSRDGLPDLVAAETWGRGERFGVVPLADGRVYVYATARAPEGYAPDDLRVELRRRYGAWHDPIPALLDRIDPAAVLRHDLYDLAVPLPRYHAGRLAWVGDAAHAMTPNLGQGGCQAIEDGVVLARLLDGDDVPAALAAYTRARHARTDAIRIRSRRAGRVAALTHPVAVAVRDLAVRATPARAAQRALDGLFGFSPA
ncbi:FAD-dependent monooxygenase [Streptomyces goshikiensis]|uniref:FAD-dependent monooxygenase n=1 Tax=Streptomyces goshikiensis TaxID=1942 RepID=UPI00372294D6